MASLDIIMWAAYGMIIIGALSKSKIIMWIGLIVFGVPAILMLFTMPFVVSLIFVGRAY